jgi:hypothetical protein
MKEFTILSLKSCNDLNEVCAKMSNLTSQKFGGVWQCFAFKRYLGGFNIWHKNSKYAYFEFCGLSFVIFEARNKV